MGAMTEDQVVNFDEEAHSANLEEFEREQLRYKFEKRDLLLEALIHPSFRHPRMPQLSYERLEHVGDSVLNFLVTRELYSLYRDCSPGSLTRLRAANVDNEKLARVAAKHGFYRYMLALTPVLHQQIQDFQEAILEYPVHSSGLVDTPKFLADIVESVVGAIYVDSNSLETVWKVIRPLLEPIISPETLKVHPMTELLEWSQKNKLKLKFVTDSLEDKTRVSIFLDETLVGTATCGRRRDVVKNKAATAALHYFKATMV
ncbi:hypothetical protein Scep_012775 [Stephania cephalantha]|uniref:RNase III domain-containing protein n=1 Tax=Stephania cephalantha TaxID=152367 RepID=A0AAP0JHZ5_9MAGN